MVGEIAKEIIMKGGIMHITQEASELLNELQERDSTYDLRFWPNKEINKETIKMIACKKLPENSSLSLGRTSFLIEKIVELGGAIDSIYNAIMPCIKQKCKKMAEQWWKENNFYRKCLKEAMQGKDKPEMQRLTELALRHYNDYCLFCRHANIEPAPIPEFITQTKSSLKYLNTKGTREKQKEQENNEKKTNEYIGKFPDKPAT